MNIYHVIDEAKWKEAQKICEYTPSSFEDDGFIHTSTEEQLLPTANRKLKHKDELRVVVIDTDKLKAVLKFEEASNGEKYPHIYGPLNTDAVVYLIKLVKGDLGEFQISK